MLRSVLRQALDEEIAQDLDASWSRPFERHDPIDGTERQRPVRYNSLEPAGLQRLAQEELRQHAQSRARDQGRHHRVAVVDAQRSRGPHAGGLLSLAETPYLAVGGEAVADAAMLGQMQGMS